MSGKKGHRAAGNIKKQPTKTVSYQASFIGPDLRRHYAPTTFTSKEVAVEQVETTWLVVFGDAVKEIG
jgi:hypothetical protein